MPRKTTLLLTCILLASSHIEAKECLSWDNSFATSSNLLIGDIDIIADDIFKISAKKEHKFFHRAANKLHITTQAKVIQQQLLFKQGDAFTQDILAESERLLRKNRYIKEAHITPVERCGKRVNIRVKTQDNWTLTPGLSFGSSGGKSRSGISLQEHNLFGLGKSIALKYKKNSERNSTLLAYKDEQLFGSRKQLAITLKDNSDGKGFKLNLNQPFYATDSQYAWGLETSSIKQENSFYHQGDIIKKIGEKQQAHSAFYGWVSDTAQQRFKVGWTYNKYSYFPTESSNKLAPSSTESYPWFEVERYHERYIKKTNFKTMDTTEDVAIGQRLNLNIGLLSKAFGSDNNYLRLSSKLSKSIEVNDNNLSFLTLEGTTYLGKGDLKGNAIQLKNEWYHFDEKANDYYVSAQASIADNLRYGAQTVLGGETGLRGYPLGYQTGNKSVLVSAEKRFHFNWYPLHIAKFGAVAFADVGSAWGKGNKAKVIADVGVGLRIVPTRSSSGKIFHLDISAPLVDRKKVDNYQVLIKTSYSF